MKRFIVSSFLFASVVVLTLGGICALEIGAELKAYRQELVAPEGATVAVAGDSQLAMGIDSVACPEFFNFSTHGKSLDQSWLSLLDIVEANPGRIRTAIFDVTPANAVGFDARLPAMGYAAQYYLLHYLHPQENIRDLSGAIKVMRDNMVGRRLRLLFRALRGKRTFRSSLFGSFTPDTPVLSRTNPAGYRAMLVSKVREVGENLPIPPDSGLFRILDGVVALREKGVDVVLITSPWCPELCAACDRARLDGFFALLRDYAGRKGVRYINLFDTPLGPECWRDGHHLNAKGAREFTRLLRQVMGKGQYGIIQGR